ncbi:hypothetical protein BDV97DRAFT_395135 [Delphinella strobiligena]|nr:hypothetical protein BDV97DRAFT_395135 [Delphinella strobiligena]
MSGQPTSALSTASPSTSSPRNSSVPLLQREDDFDRTPSGEDCMSAELGDDKNRAFSKVGKRRLFGLGRKKDEAVDNKKLMHPPPNASFMPSTQSAIAAMRPVSPIRQPPSDLRQLPTPTATTSPNRSFAISPSRAAVRSSSPQGSSLASSQIFERSVQESNIPSELSPAIPSHIQTEDHIPPALEASSLAITNNRLDPDDVEIVTSTAHQPAAAGIAEGTMSAMHSEAQLQTSPQDSQHESIYSALSRQQESRSGDGDNASNYGSLDPNDVRRLSFISFADVVQSEQAETGSIHNLPLSSTSLVHGRTQSPPLGRSPSPRRSPGSSHSQSFSQGVTTPPLGSHPASAKGLDLSPGRSPVGSPHQHGELTIETMRQALRRSGSGDLGASKSGSLPVSAIGGEDGGLERSPFR